VIGEVLLVSEPGNHCRIGILGFEALKKKAAPVLETESHQFLSEREKFIVPRATPADAWPAPVIATGAAPWLQSV
jgi:hypothetical protein